MSAVPDVERYRLRLEQRQAQLQRLLCADEPREQSVELDQGKVGRLSRMDALQQQAMADAYRGRAQSELVRVRLALKRIEEGDYGYCVECGEAIAAGRLEFDPANPLCIGCANKASS
ncbi:TraR/DksA family transcriptional regulator [Pseudomonas sp.]|uniref:TraR/DksA family transcriptional regulator n=1 Tax=Pseudomonas sp. TaxID=306 RepID=UPI003D11F98F